MRIISRLLPIILALFTVGRLSAQSCISTGVNGTVINLPCGVNCTPMNFKVPHLKSTSDYNIVSIPYNPFPYITSTGTELTTLYQDDVYGPLTTPFVFMILFIRKRLLDPTALLPSMPHRQIPLTLTR
jgi:hypothetical protein